MLYHFALGKNQPKDHSEKAVNSRDCFDWGTSPLVNSVPFNYTSILSQTPR